MGILVRGGLSHFETGEDEDLPALVGVSLSMEAISEAVLSSCLKQLKKHGLKSFD